MKKITIFIYGIISYLIGASSYFIGLSGFLANFWGPYSIDIGPQTSTTIALLMNTGLIVLFGLPHSIMARPSFKQWWTKIVPPAAERSTFMLTSGLLMLLLIWQWRPMPDIVWHIDTPIAQTALWSLFWAGWIIALIATFLINHFELAGLQQVYAHLRGETLTSPDFSTAFLYKVVRHPLQFGVLIAFWSTPQMTVGHLLLATGMTIYILIGLYFEERDLARTFGQQYVEYQQTTPKLIPIPRLRKQAGSVLRPRVAERK